MAANLPGASASDDVPVITLADLRAVVAQSDRDGLDGDRVVVRFNAVPFRMADLGRPGGSVAQSIVLDQWPVDLDPGT